MVTPLVMTPVHYLARIAARDDPGREPPRNVSTRMRQRVRESYEGSATATAHAGSTEVAANAPNGVLRGAAVLVARWLGPEASAGERLAVGGVDGALPS